MFRAGLRGLAVAVAALAAVCEPMSSPVAAAAEISPALIAAAKKEGHVTFYTPLITDQIVRPLVAAFRTKYGIPVDYLRMDSDAVVLKITNEYRARRAVADVFTTSLGVTNLIAAHAIRKFESASAGALTAPYRDPNGYWLADRLYVLVPAVNTKLVRPADRPRSFEDLLQPKWVGRMAWRSSNLTGATGFIANVLASMGEEKGMDYLRRLARQKVVQLNISDRAVLDQVIAGEYPMTLAMTNHNVEISRKEGAPVAWLPFPAMIFSEQMGVTALSPHPNAGLLFLEYTLSREGQQLFQKAGYIPARSDVLPLDPKLLPAAGGFKGIVATPDFVERNRKHWDEVFRQLFR